MRSLRELWAEHCGGKGFDDAEPEEIDAFGDALVRDMAEYVDGCVSENVAHGGILFVTQDDVRDGGDHFVQDQLSKVMMPFKRHFPSQKIAVRLYDMSDAERDRYGAIVAVRVGVSP